MKNTIASKADQSAIIAAQTKAYESKVKKEFGPMVEVCILPDYKESLAGQPKEFGQLMGAITIAAIQLSGYITITKTGAKATKGKPVSSRLFALMVSRGKMAGAFKHWYKTNQWITDKGITDDGLQMVNYRLGFEQTAPTKTGTSTGRTSPELVADFVAVQRDAENAERRIGVKGALNPTKEWRVVGAHKSEPFAK